MLIMLFIIGLIVLLFGVVCMNKQTSNSEKKFFNWVYHNEWFYFTFNVIGSVITIITLSVIIPVAAIYSESMIIDDKISLYEEENAKIEQDIGALVENYKDYESSTFENFKLDNPSMLFSMYPELKSNILVSKQIDLYVSNNIKIKELKEEKLDYRVYEWWLFF